MFNLNLIKKVGTPLFAFVVICLLMAGSSEAGDGRRNGFIMGGGVDCALYNQWKYIDRSSNETKQRIGINYLLGWSIGERNVLAFKRISLTPDLDKPFIFNAPQHFIGFKYSYYFGRLGNSIFSSFSVGKIAWYDPDRFDEAQEGLSFSFGIGYEFIKHFEVELDYFKAKSTNGGIDSNHSTILLSVNAISY